MNAPLALTHVDPRLAFLAQASARHTLVEAGELELDEAFEGLVEPFLAAMDVEDERILFENSIQMADRWEQIHPGVAPQAKTKPRQAPQATCDAVFYELRTHGVGQLNNSDCQRRLSDLSPKQFEELIRNLRRVQPPISEELIAKLEDIENDRL